MISAQKRDSPNVFFCPESVAIIGASENPNAFGTRYLEALMKFGYKGKLYAINLSGSQVFGIKVYPSVMDVPESIDLAVVSVPARIVPTVLGDCLRKKIRGAVVLSSGFSEIGEGGRILEEDLTRISHQGIRMIGDWCGCLRAFGSYHPGIFKGDAGKAGYHDSRHWLLREKSD